MNDLMESLNLPREFVNELVSKMIEHNLIAKRFHGTYSKMPAFTSFLKKKVIGAYKEKQK